VNLKERMQQEQELASRGAQAKKKSQGDVIHNEKKFNGHEQSTQTGQDTA
jgi:hypothetical protein